MTKVPNPEPIDEMSEAARQRAEAAGWVEVEKAADGEAAEQSAGEPKPEPAPTPSPHTDTADLLRPLVSLISASAPPPEVTAAEQTALAQSAADLVDHYFPGGVEQWGPLYAFVITWGAVFAPRFAAQAGARAGARAEARAKTVMGVVVEGIQQGTGTEPISDPVAAVDPFSDHPASEQF